MTSTSKFPARLRQRSAQQASPLKRIEEAQQRRAPWQKLPSLQAPELRHVKRRQSPSGTRNGQHAPANGLFTPVRSASESAVPRISGLREVGLESLQAPNLQATTTSEALPAHRGPTPCLSSSSFRSEATPAVTKSSPECPTSRQTPFAKETLSSELEALASCSVVQRHGLGPMLVDDDGDTAHEFWEENPLTGELAIHMPQTHRHVVVSAC